MKQCTKCGVKGGCNCLFTQVDGKLICGLCSGKATQEKAAEIKYLRRQQGIKSTFEGEKMAVKSVVAKQLNGQKHQEELMQKSGITCYHSASGIGDAIMSMYAACGAATATGLNINFYSKQAHWLTRASFPGVTIIHDDGAHGIDMYAGYGDSLRAGTCRKTWFANNIARSKKIKPFPPVTPQVDKTIREKRIDSSRYVMLFPFSAWTGREWLAGHWTRLALLLERAGYDVIAMDGYGDGERLKSTFKGTSAKWFWGMSPEWVTDAMLVANAVIGNDSGMVHLAGMLGVKTIAIHAQVSREQLFGLTDVISAQPRDMPCIGCGWRGERGWNKSCDSFCSALQSISPSQVMAALEPQKCSGEVEHGAGTGSGEF